MPSDPRLSVCSSEEPSHGLLERRHRHSAVVSSDGRSALWGEGVVHRSARGQLKIWLAAPTVMVLRCTGYADASHVQFIESVFDATFGSRDDLHVYFDCEEQTGYDLAFRERIASWAKRVHPQTRTYCVLVRSRIVAFGVVVANMLVGGHAVAVTSREAFMTQMSLSIERSLNDDGS